MLMTHGNFDAAEALAHEAEHLNAAYTPDEDTPRKVLDDVAKARSRAIDPTDSHALLTAARTALDHGDLDTAELLAHQA